MAAYIYTDRNGHERPEVHGMTENPLIVCQICGETMHRKPQVFAVNWNGLPPHEADRRSPAVNALINRQLPEQINHE